MKRKFDLYDLVHINRKMPSGMSHFEKDKDAIVIEYHHNECQKGNDLEHNYGLYIKGMGEVAWYHNSTLTLIKKKQSSLLRLWKKEQKLEDNVHSDLDWIFSHGSEVLKKPRGATIESIAKTLGITNLWGEHGEGITYAMNAMRLLSMVKPFLKKNDKEGWLKFVRNIKSKNKNSK